MSADRLSCRDVPFKIVAHRRAGGAHVQTGIGHGHALAVAIERQRGAHFIGPHKRAAAHIVVQLWLKIRLYPEHLVQVGQMSAGQGQPQVAGKIVGRLSLHVAAQCLYLLCQPIQIGVGKGPYGEGPNLRGLRELGGLQGRRQAIGRVVGSDPADKGLRLYRFSRGSVHAGDEGIIGDVAVEMDAGRLDLCFPGVMARGRRTGAGR